MCGRVSSSSSSSSGGGVCGCGYSCGVVWWCVSTLASSDGGLRI